MSPPLERRQFLILALVVEGGLVVLALGLSWLLKLPLGHLLKWNAEALGWGVAATLPLCLVFGAAYWKPVGPYRRVKEFLFETLGPSLAACRWYELFLVAALAGLGEELLFRGVLQTGLRERWGYGTSLIVSNIIFALCHAITITYLVLAFVMGLFLGLLLDAPDSPSLWAPIVTHGLYDFFAFWVLAWDWRRRSTQTPSPNPGNESPPVEEEP